MKNTKEETIQAAMSVFGFVPLAVPDDADRVSVSYAQLRAMIAKVCEVQAETYHATRRRIRED